MNELKTPTQRVRKLAAGLAAAAMAAAALAVSMSPAAAHPAPEPKCGQDPYAVVAAAGDAAMAELIASWHVLDTDCVVTPDEAETLIHSQRPVVVLGGTKAVPASTVDGLKVVSRIAGADRIETARKVLAWIDLPRTAATSTGAAEGPEDGALTLTVGKDIQAGTWYFGPETGVFPDGAHDSSGNLVAGFAGRNCLSLGDGSGAYGAGGITVNETDDGHTPVGLSANAYRAEIPGSNGYRTWGFVLADGDTVTLRASRGTTCEIANHLHTRDTLLR